MVASSEISVEFFKGEKSLGKHDISDFAEIPSVIEKNKLQKYDRFVYQSDSSMEEVKKDSTGADRKMIQTQSTTIEETNEGFELVYKNWKERQEEDDKNEENIEMAAKHDEDVVVEAETVEDAGAQSND